MVTIGLPFHDAGPTLLAALRSLFAQTYQDWELLLVDDGSTDGSGEIAAAVRDPRVRLIADRANRGLVARLNQITDLARGTYVCRMDADDLAHPERVEVQVKHLDSHRDVDLVGTDAISIDREHRPVGLRRAADAASLRDVRAVLRGATPIHPSVMARAEWMRRHRYDPRYPRAEDLELWVRSCATSTFDRIARPLHFYRESGSFRLDAYRRSSASVRNVLRAHGPTVVGGVTTACLVARTLLKETCYRCAAAAGAAEFLVARRRRPLDRDQLREAARAIGIVLRTPVPGVDQGAPAAWNGTLAGEDAVGTRA